MVSMLEAIARDYPDLETHFIHGALNSATHAMDKHVRSLAAARSRVNVKTFYSEPSTQDAVGLSHDYDGFITVDWLRSATPFETSEFYLCGPKPFLRALVPALARAGVPGERVHYEFFGPADELLAA
jgi:nitric oxide dioxygenase